MSRERPNSFSWGPVVLIGKGHPLLWALGLGGIWWAEDPWPDLPGVQEQHWVYGGDTSVSTGIHLCACVKEKEKGFRPRAFSPGTWLWGILKQGLWRLRESCHNPDRSLYCPASWIVYRKALYKLWNTLYVQGVILNNMIRRRRRWSKWTVRNLPESSW